MKTSIILISLATILGTALLLGCEAKDFKSPRDPLPEWTPTEERVDLNNQDTAPLDNNGLSKNLFAVDLTPGKLPKVVYIEYKAHITTNQVKVGRPSIKVEGCKGEAEIAKFLDSEDLKTLKETVDWLSFKGEGNFQQVEMGFDQPKSVDAEANNSFTLIFNVPADCSRLTGSFDLQN